MTYRSATRWWRSASTIHRSRTTSYSAIRVITWLSESEAFSVIDGTESLISLRSSWSGSLNLRNLWMNKIQRMDVRWVVCSSYSGLYAFLAVCLCSQCASVMSVPKECVTNCLTDDGMRSCLDLIIITSTLMAVTVLCSFGFPSVSFVIMSTGIEDFGKSYWSHNEASGALDKPSGLFFATVEWNAT